MNIKLQSSFSLILNDVRNTFLRPLTRQQKQILLIATAAIGFLVSCILAYRCYYKTKASDLAADKKLRTEVPVPVKELMKSKELQREKKAHSADKEFPLSEAKTNEQKELASPHPANDLVEEEKKSHHSEEVLDPLSDRSPSSRKILPLDDEVLDERDLRELSLKLDLDKPLEEDFFPDDKPDNKSQSFSLAPCLLPLGKVRKNVVPGDQPNSMGMIYFENDRVHDSENQATVLFACCFHTEESHEEIYQLLRNIRKGMDFTYALQGKRSYEEAFATLSQNLENLRDALPGTNAGKELKIYWSKSVEEELIPYLFECEKVNINNLVFAIIPGERVDSKFQSTEINFNVQLQFIGIDNKSIVEPLAIEINRLSEEILKIRIASIIGQPIKDYMLENYGIDVENMNRLMGDAFIVNLMRNVYFNLLDLKAQNNGFDLTALDREEQNNYVKGLLGSP